MMSAADRKYLLALLQGHGADADGAEVILEVAEVELSRYLAAVENHLLDPPLADKLKRIRRIQSEADDLAAEITDVLADEHQLREIAVRLTGTTPAPLADALTQAQGALLTLSARLAAVEAIKPERGRRPAPTTRTRRHRRARGRRSSRPTTRPSPAQCAGCSR
jgi:hypothetical protein